MVNYALLYKDKETQISYFYNLDDNYVYTDEKSLNIKKINTLSSCGAIIAILLYPIIRLGKLWRSINSNVLGIIIPVIGILLGWIISLFIIKNSTRFFIKENRKEKTKEEIKKMYIDGKGVKKSYNKILLGLLLFTAISTVILCNTMINMLYYIVLISLWTIIGLMYFVNRPICNRKLNKLMKKI